MSLKFAPKGLIDNESALVEVMARRRTGDKAITWINIDTVHWRIYAAQGGDELNLYIVRCDKNKSQI